MYGSIQQLIQLFGYIIVDFIGDWNGDQDLDGVLQGNATQDNTLLRKCDVTQGNSDWNASAGTNIQNSEWFIKPQNYWLDIGQHVLCIIPFIYGCTDPLASNYNSLANTDDGTCLYSSCGSYGK